MKVFIFLRQIFVKRGNSKMFIRTLAQKSPARSIPKSSGAVEIKLKEVHRFIVDGLMAASVPESEAQAQAKLLVFSDSVGHISHGSNRLEFYINDCKSGACDPKAKPCIVKESAATAWVDGKNALGATVGNFCTSVAIEKAKKSGFGWVSAKGSNHFGMAAYWASEPIKQGLIGMAFSNTSPVMVPTRSKKRALGTNPMAVAFGGCGNDIILIDIATTAVSMGKVEVQARRHQPVPLGWALGSDGKLTTDALEAYKAGLLMPLGGDESTGGYKGYALSAMVELLCSGFSGSNVVHNIRKWSLAKTQTPPNIGQSFVALNPKFFAPGFPERVSHYLKTWRNLEPMDKKRPVLAPGDFEVMHQMKSNAKGSVVYPMNQINSMNVLAQKLGIKPLEIIL